MSTLAATVIYIDDDTGRDTTQVCAFIHPASEESVETVLFAHENDDNGRSQWMWVRLQNGDLILGVFPQGDTYMTVEEDAAFPRGEQSSAADPS